MSVTQLNYNVFSNMLQNLWYISGNQQNVPSLTDGKVIKDFIIKKRKEERERGREERRKGEKKGGRKRGRETRFVGFLPKEN